MKANLSRLLQSLRALLNGLMTLYAVALVVYLLLRLTARDSFWWLALANNFAPYYFLPLAAFVPLAMLLRAWRTAARLIPLAVIGALWFGPYYLPKAAAASSGTPLKVVTFNVLPENLRINEIADWLRTLDADVILLQEVSGEEADAALAALKDVYPYQAAPLNTQRLLSRRAIHLRETATVAGGWLMRRVTLAVGEQTIAVYNVHLAWPVTEKPRLSLPAFLGAFEFALKYDESLRNAQIVSLLDILKDERLPYIVAGDFNMSDQSIIYGQLASAMGDSFRETSVGFGASWPAGESEELPDIFPPLLRLDYVWHSPHFRAVSAVQGPPLGSDHLPLVVTLETDF